MKYYKIPNAQILSKRIWQWIIFGILLSMFLNITIHCHLNAPCFRLNFCLGGKWLTISSKKLSRCKKLFSKLFRLVTTNHHFYRYTIGIRTNQNQRQNEKICLIIFWHLCPVHRITVFLIIFTQWSILQ